MTTLALIEPRPGGWPNGVWSAKNPRSAMNHGELSGGERWTGRLDELRMPALVIHGVRDPILSLEGARRLASRLSDARLTVLPGGHELNKEDWPRILGDIIRHVHAASRSADRLATTDVFQRAISSTT